MPETFLPPRPFWFADEELLANVLRKEVNAVTLLRRKHPNFRDHFDNPVATVPQRKACFMVLAHRKIMDIIHEKFAGLYKESPSLGDEESNALSGTQNLVAGDAPAWVLETNEVVELLPTRIFEALPDALRIQGFDPDNSTQVEAINLATKALSTADQIQAFIGGVLDQQLRRLKRRWAVGNVQVRKPLRRKGWQRRLKLYSAIQKVLGANPSLRGMEFCAELDKRNAPPLYDWIKCGQWPRGLTWKEAWVDPRLRKKIRRVRQEAQKRC